MNGRDAGERLACGRAWDDLLDQVADPRGVARNDHQQTCPHCQAAMTELERVWAPLRELAAEPVRAPSGLVDRVMHQVREAARQSWHSVLPGDRGSTRVAARVIATVARLAAGRVPGVRVALGRSTAPRAAARTVSATQRHHASGSAVGVAGASTVVELALAAEYRAPLHDLADQVRAAVVADLTRLVGVDTVQVHITIDDVLD